MATTPEIYIGTILVLYALAMVVMFHQRLTVTSARRRHRMMSRVGVEFSSATKRLERTVRRRCQQCRCEALCERWLRDGAEGDNAFCPNARTFARLRGA